MKLRNSTLVPLCSLLAAPLVGVGNIQNFDSLNSYAAGPDNRLMVTRDRILTGLGDDVGTRASLGYRYLDREVDPTEERFLRQTDGSGVRVGFFGGLGGWSLGLEFDYEDLTTDYLELGPPAGASPSRGSINSKGYQVALAFLGHHEGWRLGLQGGYGHADHDATRLSDAGRSVAGYDSQEFFAMARIEHVFAFEDGVELVPFAALSTTRVKTDGFSERGSPDSRVVEDFSLDEHLGVVGVRVGWTWPQLSPSVSVAWLRRLNGDSYNLVTSSLNGLDRGVGRVDSPYTSLLALGVSADFNLNNQWSLRPEVRYLRGGDDTQWTFGLGMGFSL